MNYCRHAEDDLRARDAELDRLRERAEYLDEQRTGLATAVDIRDAEIDRLRADNESLREALAGTVHVLDALRTYGKAKYEYAQGRAGSMLRVQNVIESATALLTPNAEVTGHHTETDR